MQRKSQDRKHGNDGNQYPRRQKRFSSTTLGVRLLPEQREWVHQELSRDPELTWSRMVREGLNLLKKKREGLIQELSVSDR